mmetsp:Transcript_24314/g.67728  ORF Transcript_24314/g.67728 Transcript_24314/m.67728 type:complete len:142 (-) Transcript_24314:33-458(-)
MIAVETTMSSEAQLKLRLKAVANLPANQVCCDCGDKKPTWASLIVPPPHAPKQSRAVGAFCCFHCSGAHRRLGVHICFVRSVTLDDCEYHVLSIGIECWCRVLVSSIGIEESMLELSSTLSLSLAYFSYCSLQCSVGESMN